MVRKVFVAFAISALIMAATSASATPADLKAYVGQPVSQMSRVFGEPTERLDNRDGSQTWSFFRQVDKDNDARSVEATSRTAPTGGGAAEYAQTTPGGLHLIGGGYDRPVCALVTAKVSDDGIVTSVKSYARSCDGSKT